MADTDSVEQYVEAVLSLVHDDDKRVAIRRDLVAVDVGATFLHDGATSDFAQIFDVLYLRLRELTGQSGTLLVFDEILTGSTAPARL